MNIQETINYLKQLKANVSNEIYVQLLKESDSTEELIEKLEEWQPQYF